MSNRPARRHPRYVRDIASRFDNHHSGNVVWVETTAGRDKDDWPGGPPPRPKVLDDWFPGSMREAVVAARAEYPGCRILSVEEMEWHDWVLCLQDWAEGPPG